MRKGSLLTAILILSFAVAPASGQDWTFTDWTEVTSPWNFVEAIDSSSWPQWTAVDPAGRIWNTDYYSPWRVIDADGNLIAIVDSILAPHPAGGDTLIPCYYSRGLKLLANGNLCFVKWGAMVELDPTSVTATDTAIATGVNFLPLVDGTGTEYSPVGPAEDGDGYLYVGYVVGTDPISVVDPSTFEVIQTIEFAEGAPGYSRGLEVTADASAIFPGDLGTGFLKIFTSTDLITWAFTDSVKTDANDSLIFVDQKVATFWGPSGALWVAVDDYAVDTDSLHNNFTVLDFTSHEYYRVMTPAVADGDTSSDDYGKGFRSVAFSPDETIAYISGNDQGAIYAFEKPGVKVDERDAGLPEAYKLAQNFPNPFNPSTTITYEIATSEHVKLVVYNIIGQKIRTLVNNVENAGPHTVVWDGRMDNGNPVPSGMYVYRLETSVGSIAKTAVLIK